jgi:hypothetical protein
MPKLHELSWDEIRGHLHAIAEGHSGAVVGAGASAAGTSEISQAYFIDSDQPQRKPELTVKVILSSEPDY